MLDLNSRLSLPPGNELVAELKRILAADIERQLSLVRVAETDAQSDAGFPEEHFVPDCIDCGDAMRESRAPAKDICRACLSIYQTCHGFEL